MTDSEWQHGGKDRVWETYVLLHRGRTTIHPLWAAIQEETSRAQFLEAKNLLEKLRGDHGTHTVQAGEPEKLGQGFVKGRHDTRRGSTWRNPADR